MDVKRLIILVQERPVLYDELLPEYQNYQLRLKAWQDVAKIMKQPADDCRKKWRSLRSLYNGYLRRKDKNPNPNWRYSEELSFLDKYLRRNRSSTAASFDHDPNGKLNEYSEDDSDKDETEEEVIDNNKQTEEEVIDNQKLTEKEVFDDNNKTEEEEEVFNDNEKTESTSRPKKSYRRRKPKIIRKPPTIEELEDFTKANNKAFKLFQKKASAFREAFRAKPYQGLFGINAEEDQTMMPMMTSKLNILDSDNDENNLDNVDVDVDVDVDDDDHNQTESVKSVGIIEQFALTIEDLKVFLVLLLSMIIIIVIILFWPKF